VSAALGHFQNPAPSGGIWHSLNRFLIVLILLVLGMIAAYRFLPEVSKRRDQQSHVERLKAQVEEQRIVLARNLREEELLKHDPEYVALKAREKLDLMKPGETIYRLAPALPKPTQMKRNQ
jgi:cell division protein FtsB